MVAILQPLKNHKPIPIDRAVVLVGRGNDCDVVINGSKKISRKHCCLVQSDQSFFIRDLGSTNGVWVNGKRVDQVSEMADGDRIAIGDVQFQFRPNGLRKSSGIQVPGKKEPSTPAPQSKLASSGIEILQPQSSPRPESEPDLDMIEIIDDELLEDGLIENNDVDFDGLEEPDHTSAAPPPPPPSPKRKGKPFQRKIESEPVINLDDSFADLEIDDIIDFDE